jgi:hypothetical protein
LKQITTVNISCFTTNRSSRNKQTDKQKQKANNTEHTYLVWMAFLRSSHHGQSMQGFVYKEGRNVGVIAYLSK